MKAAAERDDVISFAGGLPADDLLPTAAISAALERVMAEHGREALQYHWAEGYEPLRGQIVALMRERGVEVGDGELLITHGAQQALDLLARLFLRTGDPLAIESPTYAAALEVFRLQRPQMCPISRAPEGLDLDAMRRVLQDRRPSLMYLSPAGHNPLGDGLSTAAYAAIVEAARKYGCFVIEDDAYGKIQYDGPRPPLRAHPGAQEVVLHVGSFSKILMPGLRVGWLVAPREVVEQLLQLKGAADLQTSSLSQIALSMYLEDNDLGAHVRRCLEVYRERRDALLAALERELGGALRGWTRPSAGFSVWLELPAGGSAEALLATAVEHGVAFEPGGAYFPEQRPPEWFRLSFSNLKPERICEGVRRLAAALRAG